MNDLISRQAAISEKKMQIVINNYFKSECNVDTSIRQAFEKGFRIGVKKGLTVQPKRLKGKWIYGEHDIAMCDGYWCDQCGFFVPWDYKHKSIDFIKDYHWCPSCRADMRGEQA